VAYHGIALNVATDLTYFAHIVACRTPALASTSLAELLGTAPPVMRVGERFAANLAERLGFAGVELEAMP
jgi:lipoate-protein ligase B